jgi:hypothetical protein
MKRWAMLRWWFTRIIAILLIVACSAAWLWSYYDSIRIDYTNGGDYIEFSSRQGRFIFGKILNYPFKRGRWHFYNNVKDWYWDDLERVKWGNEVKVCSFMGFEYFSYPPPTYPWFVFSGPYWAVDSVAILIGLYVWRRKRPKLNPATAFPIETKKPSENSA